MKKIVAICIILAMVLSCSIPVFAAPRGFVSSPSQDPAPDVDDFEPSDEECEGDLIITAYKDKSKLPKEIREALDAAYAELHNAKDISALNKEFKEAVKKKGINHKDLLVGDLFDMHIEGCADHYGHDKFTITISSDKLKNFVGLMYRDDNGNWQYVSNAKVINNGKALRFTVSGFSPFAIIVRKDILSPQTSANNLTNVYVVLAAVVALAVVFGCKKTKKQTA